VLKLAELARSAGIDGLVCSPQELAPLRARFGKDFFLCTPGIRPAGAEKGDQARAETPAFAKAAGADLLVIGRPIHGAPDPVAAAKAIHAELGGS
jgi:orotidine-5'-phosphate decarboxylase